MGACNVTENISKHEINFLQEQSSEHDHKVSSAMKTKNNSKLFQLSDFKSSDFSTLTFRQSMRNDVLKNMNLEQQKTNSKKLGDIKEECTVQNNKQNEKTFPFTQKENLFLKEKTPKKGNRNSSIRISGQFLKIKQKQACSQYKVLAKITNKKIGQLYKVLDKTTNQVRSLEIIKEDKATERTINEINLLKKLDHPNIYHLYDVFLKKGFYYIIGQYIQGDNIYCLTRENEVISEKMLSKVFKQIFQALNYLHYRGIMHRNIKPETIVFQSKLQKSKKQFPGIKLINFKKAAEISVIREQVGSFYFMAPEVFIGGHNEKCDIWSVGVILYMLTVGELPFKGQSKEEIQKNVVGKDLVFEGKNWENKSQPLKQLLKQLLHKSPSKRITAKEALSSKWFQEASEHDKILISKSTMKNLLFVGGDSKFKTIIKTYLVKMTTSMEERQQMAKKFQSIDKDQSGFIDKKELIEAYKMVHGQQISKQVDIDQIIENIDINNSGQIDFSQFMAAISRVETLFAKERLEKAFEFIDRDGTGEIEISELIQLLNTELENEDQSEEDEQIAEIMKDFDHDGDRTISKKEFIDFFMRLKDVGRIKSVSNFSVDTS